MVNPVGRPRSTDHKGKMCSVEGCDKPYASIGLCNKHWYRLKHHGDVNGGKSRHSLLEHLENSQIDPKTGCKIWAGSISKGGYGHTYLKGKPISAHRGVYILSGLPIPTFRYDVHHTCENKLCVNLEHLVPLSVPAHGQLHGKKYRKG